MTHPLAFRLVLTVLLAAAGLAGCERPPVTAEQRGYRGLAMDQITNPRRVAATATLHQPPAAVPDLPAGGPLAKDVFKNVQVLGDLGVNELTRTMLAITAWLGPKEGCNYCHVPEDLSLDTKYTKVVARRMLQMTRHINNDWQPHVAATGVTCYTCHRGQPVPAQVWFSDPGPRRAGGTTADSAGQNVAAVQAALTALPYDPLTPFLLKGTPIRVVSPTALPAGNRQDIKQTEWTYGLMSYISQSLGVNCTFCHNSRNFGDWSQSPPQRLTAFHGIRMTRELNNDYMLPLTSVFPATRRGELGDVAKIGCVTCHVGVSKPLYGVPLAKDHAQALQAPPPKPAAAATPQARLPLEPSAPSATAPRAQAGTAGAVQLVADRRAADPTAVR